MDGGRPGMMSKKQLFREVKEDIRNVTWFPEENSITAEYNLNTIVG